MLEDAGRPDIFQSTRWSIVRLAGEESPAGVAALELGMSEGSLKVALHRLRERLYRCLLEIVSETVTSPEEAREELRYLFRALSA